MRARLAFISNTHLDIAYAVSMDSAVTTKSFGKEKIEELIKVVRPLRATRDIKLKYPRLYTDSLKIVVFSDSSYVNNDDLRSMPGFITALLEKSNQCSILHLLSHKSKCVCRSTILEETLTFVDSFDSLLTIKHDIELSIGHKINMQMMTDSQTLLDALTRAKYTMRKTND